MSVFIKYSCSSNIHLNWNICTKRNNKTQPSDETLKGFRMFTLYERRSECNLNWILWCLHMKEKEKHRKKKNKREKWIKKRKRNQEMCTHSKNQTLGQGPYNFSSGFISMSLAGQSLGQILFHILSNSMLRRFFFQVTIFLFLSKDGLHNFLNIPQLLYKKINLYILLGAINSTRCQGN